MYHKLCNAQHYASAHHMKMMMVFEAIYMQLSTVSEPALELSMLFEKLTFSMRACQTVLSIISL